MRLRVVYLLLLFFTLLVSGSCTNDETDEGLEVITPNDKTETGISGPQLQHRNPARPAIMDSRSSGATRS